jgi:hypothetical protein
MATEFCQKCKGSHPGRLCDYDEKGDCAETVDAGDPGENKRADGPAQAESRSGHDPEEDRTQR